MDEPVDKPWDDSLRRLHEKMAKKMAINKN